MRSLTQSRDEPASLVLRGQPANILDGFAIALFAGAGAWMILTSAESGGSAVPGVELLLACGLVVMAARALGPRARLVVPPIVLVAALIVVVRSKTGVLGTAPLSGPFRYTNADGAFYAQVAIAGLMLALGARRFYVRLFGGVGAIAFAALPIVIHAEAAGWLVLVLPGIALSSAFVFHARGVRAVVALCGLLFAASLVATIWLGATYSTGAASNILQRMAIRTVDEHRLVLWHDAFVIMHRHSTTGVGPGRYQVVSPIAKGDPDSRWAHNEFLQQGAEGGIAGLGLLAAIFVCGFARLLVVDVPTGITGLSAASLAALGIHGSIDYIMHFPAIPITAAGLVAIGMINGRSGS